MTKPYGTFSSQEAASLITVHSAVLFKFHKHVHIPTRGTIPWIMLIRFLAATTPSTSTPPSPRLANYTLLFFSCLLISSWYKGSNPRKKQLAQKEMKPELWLAPLWHSLQFVWRALRNCLSNASKRISQPARTLNSVQSEPANSVRIPYPLPPIYLGNNSTQFNSVCPMQLANFARLEVSNYLTNRPYTFQSGKASRMHYILDFSRAWKIRQYTPQLQLVQPAACDTDICAAVPSDTVSHLQQSLLNSSSAFNHK